jgi:hypothetical protein
MVEIGDALRAIFRASDKNFSLSANVSGFVTVHLRDVPFDTVLRYLLNQADATYSKEENDTIYVIVPKAVEPPSPPEPHLYTILVNVRFHEKEYFVKAVINEGGQVTTEQVFDLGEVTINVGISTGQSTFGRSARGGFIGDGFVADQGMEGTRSDSPTEWLVEATYTFKIHGRWPSDKPKDKDSNAPETPPFTLDSIVGHGTITLKSGVKTLVLEGGPVGGTTSKAVSLTISRG